MGGAQRDGNSTRTAQLGHTNANGDPVAWDRRCPAHNGRRALFTASLDMQSIAQQTAADRFLAKFTREKYAGASATEEERARRILNLGLGVPDEDALNGAWNTGTGQTRRERRAVRAAEGRSVRTEAAPRTAVERAKLAAERAGDRRYREGLDKRSRDWDGMRYDAQGKAWRAVPAEIWIACKDLGSCTSGQAWRYHAARVKNKAYLGAVRRAALLPYDDGTGRTRRGWGDEAARRVALLGIALYHLAAHTERKGAFSRVVRGIPVAALQELCAYPDGSKVPHRSTLTGHHRGVDSRAEAGELGYLRMLEWAGAISAQQWYPDAADWEVGREGYQINRYWLLGDPPPNGPRRVELIELVRDGWRALTEHAQRWRVSPLASNFAPCTRETPQPAPS